MVLKICEICQKEFVAVQRKEKYCSDECYKEARRRQGRTPKQRARKARNKADQRARNPEHIRQLVRDSRERHRDKRNAENRQWNKEHPEYSRDHSRKWRAEHPDCKKQEHARYYPNHREVVRARVSRRRARLLQAEGTWTKEEFIQLCEAVDWFCAYCYRQFDKLTHDHIIPISRGGSNDITNIIPACLPCNLKKHTSTPLEYLIRLNS